ncbi:Aste57867_5863 [Aphanomyces stellatus]|uniref:Aste57867_5863 protein n=1 Tax=Aphanomyces stellatus TaxID=120398 RepID=A0A485KHM0_9STRA|nr:hypothetical protein As57867_005849 [Aphanomyces stellatus]VFT82886.1 Aste57867_5863 [Aphanomyces stellatus]
MSTPELTVSVVVGSVRPGRMGIRVAKCVEAKLKSKGLTVHLIDPVELNLPLFLNRFDYIPEDERPPVLVELQRKFAESDAVVVVSPEYNHTFSPVISNTLNYFYHPEFYYKVAGIVTYSMGSFGGSRAGVALRPYLSELGFVTIPEQMTFSVVRGLLDDDGNVRETAGEDAEALENSAESLTKELIWYSALLKQGRAAGVPKW